MTRETRVDALAVLDREIERAGSEAFHAGRELIAARTAVSELIEKANRCADRLEHLCETRLRGEECHYSREDYQALRAALRRLTPSASDGGGL